MTTTPPTPARRGEGLFSPEEIPMAAYLDDPCPDPSLSSGACHRIITRSPYHVWWTHPRLGAYDSDTGSAADVGSVAHDLILGGEGNIVVVDADDWRTKAAKEERDAARNAGKTPVLAHQFEEAQDMAASARAFVDHSELLGVFTSGLSEMTMIAKDPATGVWLRARPDWVNDEARIMLHLKTTRTSANPAPFIRGIMHSMGYDVSLAFYRRVGETLGITDDRWQHVILAVEQEAPYACSLIALSPVAMAVADDKVTRGIQTWARCMKTGNWPAYPSAIHYAEPTAWQLAEAEAAAAESAAESAGWRN